jgi:hypothetical protein
MSRIEGLNGVDFSLQKHFVFAGDKLSEIDAGFGHFACKSVRCLAQDTGV